MANVTDAAQAIGQVQTYLDASVQLGSLVYPVGAPVVSAFTAIATVLSLINSDGMAKQTDPALIEIQESINRVSLQLDAVDQKIDKRFDSLKGLIVEKDFMEKIIDNVKILETYMAEIIKYRTKKSVRTFKEGFKKHNPQELVIKITERMRRDVSNPIIHAIESDVFKSREIFDTWMYVIKNALSTLTLAHSCNEGLEGKGREVTHGPMHDALERANRVLEEFVSGYEVNYWPSQVRNFMLETADNNQGSSHEAKADIIRNALAGIYTNDQFYVLVYNDCTGYHKHSYLGGSSILEFRRGGVNMAVIRSRSAATASQEDMKAIETGLEATRNDKITDIEKNDQGFIPSMQQIKPNIKRSGLMVAILKENNVAVRWTGGHQYGPGWWITTPIIYMKRVMGLFGPIGEKRLSDEAFVLVSMQ